MRLALTIAALSALPALAWGQVGAMICKPSFDGRSQVCQASPAEQADQLRLKGQADLEDFMADDPAPRRAKGRQPAASRQHTLVAMDAGALIAEGKCDEALRSAVDGKAMDVAQIVREVCSR